MITIDSQGVIGRLEESDRQQLTASAGQWTVDIATPAIVLLQRADSAAQPLMAGIVTTEGWIVDVVAQVSSSRLTGVLCTFSAGVQRELFFDRGALRMANSTAKSDLLGEFLVTEGAITREQLDEALAAMRAGRKLGEALVAIGAISGADVYWLLLRKIEKIFNDVIALRSGSFYFLAGIDFAKLPAALFIDTQALLMEGVRRIDELEYCRQTIPILSKQVQENPSLSRACSDVERLFLEQVDGQKTVIAIEQDLQLGLHTAARALDSLKQRGFIEVITAERVEETAIRTVVDGFNRALSLVYQAAAGAGFREELVRTAREFPLRGKHGNKALARLQLGTDGLLQEQTVRDLVERATDSNRVKFVIVLLTQFVSYVLFTANSGLPVEQQRQLSAEANAALAEVIAVYL